MTSTTVEDYRLLTVPFLHCLDFGPDHLRCQSLEGSCFDDSDFVAKVAAVDPEDSIRVDAETCSQLECSLSHSCTAFGILLSHLVCADWMIVLYCSIKAVAVRQNFRLQKRLHLKSFLD